jgi:putative acetyltransferase
MNIRPVREADLPELAILFRETVQAIAPQRYTPDQTRVWASFAADREHFDQFILTATTYVAEDETGLIGFAGIAEDGHVSATYVRGDRVRQGVGSALMQILLAHAAQCQFQRLYAEASEFSLGLFQKFGFHCYATEIINRQGVQFKRYLVERIG